MSEKAQGFEEYTPSRLEWLVVLLNSYTQYIGTMPGEHVSYVYTPGGDGNTIIMQMRHFADLPSEIVKAFENSGKQFALDIAKNYKWDSWINIQTQLNPIDRSTTKQQD